MAGIWINSSDDAAGWELGAPSPFPDEATLHRLIAENPQLLPLAGSPQLTVLGSEVQLGTGSADILAVEPSGRPAIIEVKLARNSEARRAVVAQVLAYAAFLRGNTVEDLEQGSLQTHLSNTDHKSILEAVQAEDQEGVVDEDSFTESMQGFLDRGDFRLVLVLDDTSDELERIVAYLDTITIQALTVDLITMSLYEVNGAQVALPQRISPDLSAATPPASYDSPAKSRGSTPATTEGTDAFRVSIDGSSSENQETFDKLIAWAEQIAELPNVRLVSTVGVQQTTLRPIIRTDDAGLITIVNSGQQPYIYGWRSVFERRAPTGLANIDRRIAPHEIGQGTWVPISPDVLEALTAAYREAVGVDD